MRLINASDPGAVSRFEVRTHFDQRLLLTRAVIAALREAAPDYTAIRPKSALDMLQRWIGQHYEYSVGLSATTGLESMVTPPGCEEEALELGAASAICESLCFVWTADTRSELERDLERIADELDEHRW